MHGLLRQLAGRQHVIVALFAVWLILTSPWVTMLGRMPREPGLLDYAHVAVGFATLLLGVTYFRECIRSNRWRLYFPWLSGQFATIRSDLRELVRGRVPSADGGGLFATIEGLALLALLAAALTGAAWFVTQGSPEAMDWRSHHILAARALTVLIIVHTVTVALHVLEFIKD